MRNTLDDARMAARIKLVEEHIRLENAQELDSLMTTFGAAPTFDLNRDRISGHDGIHAFYGELMRGFPDFHIDVVHQHVSDQAIIVEVLVTGTHQNSWSGIPPTGRRIEVPVCVAFPFDADERLGGERVYFDMALWLRQHGAVPDA
jgi:steroid delta-isomerase-like uncharacterized protein